MNGTLIQIECPLRQRTRYAAAQSRLRWLRAQLSRPLLPSLPDGPTGMVQRIGIGITFAMMVMYVAILLRYVVLLHHTYQTPAEDLGIMDQVLWNTVHGHFWQETICNSVSDMNCLAGTSRWGIHFEPLMLALVPVYALFPGVQTLQFVQIAGVALGAIPAYLLGSRRLGHAAGGVVLAAIYLIMPVLRVAVIDDFHMVTLAAPLLMLALYALYLRNDRLLIIACILAMGTKEQVPLDVFMVGVAALVLQRRPRIGLIVMALAVAWIVVALGVIHMVSPLGASPTAARYHGVLGTLRRLPLVLHDPLRRTYINTLLDNTGQLGLFAPWVLMLAMPSILLNALSSLPNQYSGLFQYNADIAPLLVLATLEGMVVIAAGTRFVAHWLCHWRRWPLRTMPFVQQVLGVFLVLFALNMHLLPTNLTTLNPMTLGSWPHATAHTQLAQRFIAQVPKLAPVSAQSDIVPHLSERPEIYQYPDGVADSDYILLDFDDGFYPEPDEATYTNSVKSILQSGLFTVLDADDGYVLLRATPTPQKATPVTLPLQFCPHLPLTEPLDTARINTLVPCYPT